MNYPKRLLTRRDFVARLGRFTALAAGLFSGLGFTRREPLAVPGGNDAGDDDGFDYIVVGSGAGGGPLACNLARAGHRVMVMEAGGRESNANYEVPVFHAKCTEDPAFSWEYFVRHYAGEDQQARDWKYRHDRARGGVFYPRAGTLGGCTAHHAMITMYPHPDDWNHIAVLTGDDSWRDKNMRRYFKRLERCQYVDPLHAPFAGHGFWGWLPTTQAGALAGAFDAQIRRLAEATFGLVYGKVAGTLRLARFLVGELDPNNVSATPTGVYSIPISVSTADGQRRGTREYLVDTETRYPHNLKIQTHALVTRVLFAPDDLTRAIGVEYMDGAHLYRADPNAVGVPDAPRRQVFARREVILSGGAFNTPQLLMLSGIGPAGHLCERGIDVRVPLAGVGRNLQDRAEVGVVSEMHENFSLLKKAEFREGDPEYRHWKCSHDGTYASNGGLLAVLRNSLDGTTPPDQFIFALAGHFEGYFRGWSELVSRYKHRLTWCVLKTDPGYRGVVELRSRDPRTVPDIDFRYFPPGPDTEKVLASVVDGIEFARKLNAAAGSVIKREVVPGPEVQGAPALRQFVKDNAWGHHACGTCAIGRREEGGVLDTNFCVHGTSGLRVVDASVFPKIPGTFIVLPIYMISEKASDVILAAARLPGNRAGDVIS